MLFTIFKNTKGKYRSKEEQIQWSFRKGTIIGGTVAIVFGVVITYGSIQYTKAKTTKDVLYQVEKQKQGEKKVVKLKKELRQGAHITNADYYIASESKAPTNAVSESALKNKILRIDAAQDSTITAAMLTTDEAILTSDLRTQDYSHIVLNKLNLQKGSFVDIRYKKKDGTDLVVVAKKPIIDLNGNTFSTKIYEDERILLNNATVKAVIEGATLYTTIYPDPSVQPAAVITYEADDNVKAIIEKNPNIVKDAENELRKNINSDGSSNSNSTNNQANNQSQTNDGKPQFVDK